MTMTTQPNNQLLGGLLVDLTSIHLSIISAKRREESALHTMTQMHALAH